MIVLTVADLLNSIDQFFTVFTPCLIACAIVIFIFLLAERNITLFGDNRYNYISQMHREAFKLLAQGLSEEEILLKLRGMRFGFQLFPATKERTIKKVQFAEAVLNSDRIMLQYVIVPSFDKKTFKALKKEMNSIIEDKEKRYIQDKAFVSLRFILNDNSGDNVERVQKLLVKLYRKPFVLAEILGEDCSEGMYTTYVLRALQRLDILNTNGTYGRYIQCLQWQNRYFGNMSLISSKATISRNLSNLDNHKLESVQSKINELLNAPVPTEQRNEDAVS